eukprot:11206856-Lingulodinium_polyedra.AAC.1
MERVVVICGGAITGTFPGCPLPSSFSALRRSARLCHRCDFPGECHRRQQITPVSTAQLTVNSLH